MKVLIGDTIFIFPAGDKSALPFYVVIRATQRSSHLKGKGDTFSSQFSVIFNPWLLVSEPENQTCELPPAVKRSKNYRTFLNNSRPSINHLPQVLKKIASFVSIFTLFFSISRRAVTLHMLSMKCMQEWLNKLRLPSTIWSWCLKRLLSWCSPHSVIPTVKCTSTNFRIYLHCWP